MPQLQHQAQFGVDAAVQRRTIIVAAAAELVAVVCVCAVGDLSHRRFLSAVGRDLTDATVHNSCIQRRSYAEA